MGDLHAVDGKELAFFPHGTRGQAPLRVGHQTIVGPQAMPVAAVDDSGRVGWLPVDWTGTVG